MGEAGVMAVLSKNWAESVRSDIQKQGAASSSFITKVMFTVSCQLQSV